MVIMDGMEIWDWTFRLTYNREMTRGETYRASLTTATKAADGALAARDRVVLASSEVLTGKGDE